MIFTRVNFFLRYYITILFSDWRHINEKKEKTKKRI